MYIDGDTIIRAAAILGSLIALGTAAYAVIKWFQKQEKQTVDIEDLRKKEEQDLKELRDISIHALREEGDSKNRDKISIFKQIIQHSARI